ncbi:MAG: ABC transporter permease [Wenzhouxiangella sp.]
MTASDFIQAGRALSRSSGFFAVGVLTLALAIAASTAVFSLFDHVIVRALPFAEPDRLVFVDRVNSPAEYAAMRDHLDQLGPVAAHSPVSGMTLSGPDRPQRLPASRVSSNFFTTLGLTPAQGRDFRIGEDGPDGGNVVIISERFRRQHFGPESDALGHQLILDGKAFEVVGVMPPEVRFPADEVAVWLPISINPTNTGSYWGDVALRVIARLKPGAGVEGAQAQLDALAGTLRLQNPLWTPDESAYLASFRLVGLKNHLTGPLTTPLAALMVAVVLVLMMACVNLSNLFLARALTRRQEFAIRASLGAGTSRLIRSSLAELAWIVIPGGLLGIALAWWLTARLPGLLPAELPIAAGVSMDGRVLGFALLATIAAALIAGLIPAMRAGSSNSAEVLAAHRQGGDARASRISQCLVTIQIALAVVLTIGAGLSLKTLAAFAEIDPGFSPVGLVTARLDPVPGQLNTDAAMHSMHAQVLERTRALPGVEQAGLSNVGPLAAADVLYTAFDLFDDRQGQGSLPMAYWAHVTPGYLETLGTELIQGRLFDATDRADALPVVLISHSLAQRYFPDGNAVGRRIGQPWWDNWWTVVGVVGDVYFEALDQPQQLAIYRPLAQDPRESVELAIRTRGDPGLVINAISTVIDQVDYDIAISQLRTGEQRLAQATAQPRFYGQLLAAFALAAMLLAMLGVHGMAAQLVGRRRREIGIRMAIGATPGRILAFVMTNFLVLASVGLGLGILTAVMATRGLEAMLFGVESLDVMTFVLVSGLILLVSALSALMPALRALRTQPARVLGEQ